MTDQQVKTPTTTKDDSNAPSAATAAPPGMMAGGVPPPNMPPMPMGYHPGPYPPMNPYPGNYIPPYQMMNQQQQQQQQPPLQFIPPPPPPHQMPMYMPGPPPGAIPPPNFAMQYPIDVQMRLPQSSQAQKVRYPDKEYLTGYDMHNIVTGFERNIRKGQTGDDYTDDYYFVQYQKERERSIIQQQQQQQQQQQSLARHSSSSSQGTVDAFSNETPDELRPSAFLKQLHLLREGKTNVFSSPSQPSFAMQFDSILPSLPGSRTFVFSKRATTKANSTTGGKNKKGDAASTAAGSSAPAALGRAPTSSIRRPHELLSISPEIMSQIAAESKNGSGPFSNVVWNLRNAVALAHSLVIEIKDLHRLLSAKANALGATFATMSNAEKEMIEKNIQELENQQVKACTELASCLGLNPVDDTKILGILWLQQGRSCLLKSLFCLLPEHQLSLCELVCKYVPYFVCKGQEGGKAATQQQKEEIKMDMACAKAFGAEFSSLDYDQTNKCMRLFLSNQSPESLRVLLRTISGAELIRCLVAHGTNIFESGGASAEQVAEWESLFGAFVTHAEEGIGKSKKGKKTKN